MRNKIIIFGRSPFINRIDFDKIDYDNFSICCLNTLNPKLKRIDYVVSVDDNVMFAYDREFEWISANTGWLFKETGSDYTVLEKCLSWAFFSSSAAVSFAILRGYKEIYLAGVDLIGGRVFEHYDGKPTNVKSEDMCNAEKNFIREICGKYGVKVFTLNPDNNWTNLIDIGVLK